MSFPGRPSSPPRACIVTPCPIGSNPRVVKEAHALYEAGLEITVITTRTFGHLEQPITQRIPWRLQRIDLRSRLRWRLRRAVQIGLRWAHSVTGVSGFADMGFSPFTAPLLTAALRTPADIYIAHYPAALPAAAAAARRHGARFAYDAEDFHPGDWPDDPRYNSERLLLRAIEQRYLPGCSHITAASPGIADAYAEAYGIPRPQVVLNVFPLDRAPLGPTVRGNADPGPSVYWFSQTIGPDRGLECAVRAIGRTKTCPHIYLRGTPARGYIEHLQEVAAQANAVGRLHILPPDEPDRMERLAAGYDIGLVAETAHTRNRDICLANKMFTYLLAGIPAIMSDTTAHRAFAAETGMTEYLYPVDDPDVLASILDQLLSDPDRLYAARAEAYQLGRERYNWDKEKRILIDTVWRSIGFKEERMELPS